VENRDVRKEPWAKNAPDYMVEAIAAIVETRDDCRQLLGELNARDAEHRSRVRLLEEQRAAFQAAVADLKEYADKLYGPDSEVTALHKALGDLARRVDDLELKSA